jgi:hypothetical protein
MTEMLKWTLENHACMEDIDEVVIETQKSAEVRETDSEIAFGEMLDYFVEILILPYKTVEVEETESFLVINAMSENDIGEVLITPYKSVELQEAESLKATDEMLEESVLTKCVNEVILESTVQVSPKMNVSIDEYMKITAHNCQDMEVQEYDTKDNEEEDDVDKPAIDHTQDCTNQVNTSDHDDDPNTELLSEYGENSNPNCILSGLELIDVLNASESTVSKYVLWDNVDTFCYSTVCMSVWPSCVSTLSPSVSVWTTNVRGWPLSVSDFNMNFGVIIPMDDYYLDDVGYPLPNHLRQNSFMNLKLAVLACKEITNTRLKLL